MVSTIAAALEAREAAQDGHERRVACEASWTEWRAFDAGPGFANVTLHKSAWSTVREAAHRRSGCEPRGRAMTNKEDNIAALALQCDTAAKMFACAREAELTAKAAG